MKKGGLLGLTLFLVVALIVGLLALAFLGMALLGIFTLGHGDWFKLSSCHCECSPLLEAGEIKEVGVYNGSKVYISNVPGKLIVESGNSSIVISSNLPVNVSQLGDEVVISCSECYKYKNGIVIVRGNLSELEVGKVMGKVEVGTPLKVLKIGDVMGSVEVLSPVEVFESGDIMGKVRVKVLKLVKAEDVLGKLEILVPRNYSVDLKVDDVLGNVKNEAKGDKKVKVELEDVMGRVEIVNG
ncbi:hypothetical protein PNA2_0297 [Pyrococcus sp. NA2]|uniref:hypothetical protein n=1 Tax=Pyrococcus sp. (strain NA2) TaxID=342949 RepID=UPI000209B042|nr:hypothetical protein [Pyrococcus sp. NA2]AEC51215.1 hypothetical protein PNA2_0297 [Pyrococcus sp. NA2]